MEIYNPGDAQRNLTCYLISDSHSPKSLTGTLGPNALRAWGQKDLGFRLKRAGDKVSLMRIQQGGGQTVEDFREIHDSNSYQQRVPDGGDAWEEMSHDAVKAAGHVGSWAKQNKSIKPR